MGEVFLAEDLKLKRKIAIKFLTGVLQPDAEKWKRFRTEAEAAAKLNHPSIATIYSIESEGSLHFITMEYVDGQPMDKAILAKGIGLEKFFK
jgi:serine/threonine-protein kinase